MCPVPLTGLLSSIGIFKIGSSKERFSSVTKFRFRDFRRFLSSTFLKRACTTQSLATKKGIVHMVTPLVMEIFLLGLDFVPLIVFP